MSVAGPKDVARPNGWERRQVVTSRLTCCKSESLWAFISTAEIGGNSTEEASETWCFLGEAAETMAEHRLLDPASPKCCLCCRYCTHPVCKLWLNVAQACSSQSQPLWKQQLCNELQFSAVIALGEHRSVLAVPACILAATSRFVKALLPDDCPLSTGICLAQSEG